MTAPSITPLATELFQYFVQMHRIRAVEEKILELRKAGDIVGSVHLCNGQEAIYVGAASTLDPRVDAVFPTYRGHGWALAMGVPPVGILAELLGREAGISGGRGGSAYFTAPEYGMYGENSIVGAAAPIATGSALGATFDKSSRISVASFGDGAVNQGAVHEAMNFAATRRLPVIFLIENNGYAEMTPASESTRDQRLFKRAAIYGFTGMRIDGNDPIAVARAFTASITQIRKGLGPVLIEAMTARLVGHYIGDAQQYRPQGEVDRDLLTEPIKVAGDKLLELGVIRSELDASVDRVHREISEATAEALSSPLATSALEHLYA